LNLQEQSIASSLDGAYGIRGLVAPISGSGNVFLLPGISRDLPGAIKPARHGYEYEPDRLAIDVINGSPLLREWVDDAHAMPEDLETITRKDEQGWEDELSAFLLY
jgi:hypothetical protein